MYTYDLVLLWPYLLISRPGVCRMMGNAISLVAQSWLIAVSTSTTKNRCITHDYTTKGGPLYQFRWNFRGGLTKNTTIKILSASKYTTNIVQILLIIDKYSDFSTITTIKNTIESNCTTNYQINTLGLPNLSHPTKDGYRQPYSKP